MLERYLRDLNSRHRLVREATLYQARELPPEELLALAAFEAEQFRQRRRRVSRLTLYVAAGVFGASLVPFVALGDTAYLFGAFLHAGCVLPLQLLAYLPTRARRGLIRLLATTDDPRFLSPALAILTEGADASLRQSILTGLKRLLPRLRADQAGDFTPQERQMLLSLLEDPYADVDLTLGVLKALEQVGDASAIPLVRELANGAGATARIGEIRLAARECLPSLRSRSDKARSARTLLRAAVAAQPHDLLRPVATVADRTPSDQLLRPHAPVDAITTPLSGTQKLRQANAHAGNAAPQS